MCGILAAIAAAPGPFALRPGLDALAHRGPDGHGLASSACGRVHLGHTRLALVDLAGGQQPVASEDGQILAVVNGEFYDDNRLRATLRARGHRLRSRCDSELLVHLYEDHGADALQFLRGEFAFALWDQRRQRLWAARDRFGIKPLVYARHEGRVLLASEVKALLALGVPRAWDTGAFFQAASLQYLLPDRTLFAGVSTLPPGHTLETDGRTITVRSYWDLDYPASAAPDALTPLAASARTAAPGAQPTSDDQAIAPGDQGAPGDQEAADELRRRLDEAVALRLRGDTPVACQLSGGIDSAAVLASASRAAGRPLDAFTISFGGPYDEARQAQEIAAFVGARLHVIEATPEALAGAFADAVVAGEGLAINGHIAAKHLLTRAIHRAGYKVALTGEGADEVLAGYAHLRADLAGGSGHLETTNQASAGLMLPAGASLPLDAVERGMGYIPTWIRAKGTMGYRVRGLLREELRERFAGHDAAGALVGAFDVGGQLAGRGRVEQALYLWTRLALGGYILRTLGDAQEMAHGVEGRLPFLDHELFGWLRGLPVRLKIRGGVEKYVLRGSQRGRLPAGVLSREKHPFVAPPMAGRMAELAGDVLRGAAFRGSPLFDADKVIALLDALPTMTPEARKHSDPVLYLALSAAVLGERFGLG